MTYAESYDDYIDSGYYGGAPERSEREQFFAVVAVLRKYWLMIVAVTLVGTGAVIVYVAQQPDYYTASVRIQVNNETNPAVGGNSPNQVIMNPGADPAYFSTQLQILEGPGLLRRVAKTMDLEHNSSFLNPSASQNTTVWQNVLKMFGLYRPPGAARTLLENKEAEDKLNLSIDSTGNGEGDLEKLAPYVSAIKRNLDVNPVRDNRTAVRETRLIEVRYTHANPDIAAKVVNTIADTYVLQNLEVKVQTNASAGDFLQRRVAELQSQIRQGEENLINYAKNNEILSLDSSQDTVVQRLASLNSTLSQAEIDRITAEAALRAAQQNPLRDVTAQTRDARTSSLESQLSALRQQLTQLKVEFTEEWPAVKEVQRKIAAIESELQTSRRRSSAVQLSDLEQQFREASAREAELRNSFKLQRNAVLNQNQAAINYRIIEQEIATNKALLDNLLQRSRETEVILNGTPNNVNVVDRALPPGSPQGPNRSRSIMLAFFSLLFGGIGLSFVLNWLDDTVRPNDNFELLNGVPVIGMIPGADDGFGRRLLGSRFTSNGKVSIGKHVYSLESFEKPVIAEAFHQFRTSLLLSSPGGAPKSVLITSGQPFEGKTVASQNLAKSLAQLGNRVLLLDADLRCPKLHLINELSNSAGLSTLLTSERITQESIKDTIQKEVLPFLDVLTSGPKVPNPANLLGSAEMEDLLKRLGSIYSHIIIDSPPILYFADSMILAVDADAVVIVARAHFSSRDVHKRAVKKVEEVRGNVIGVVINDVPLSNYKYRNNGYYREIEAAESHELASDPLHLE